MSESAIAIVSVRVNVSVSAECIRVIRLGLGITNTKIGKKTTPTHHA